MILISAPDHRIARLICNRLGLRRLRGAWKFPVFADTPEPGEAARILFVRDSPSVTVDAAWSFMLGRVAANTDPRRIIAAGIFRPDGTSRGPAMDGEPFPAAAARLLLVNRADDESRHYYPDILVNPGFVETTVSAGGGVGAVFDSQAPSFCRTTLYFLGPHQIACVELLDNQERAGSIEIPTMDSGGQFNRKPPDFDLLVTMALEMEAALPDPMELNEQQRTQVNRLARQIGCSRAENDRLLRLTRSYSVRHRRFPAELFEPPVGTGRGTQPDSLAPLIDRLEAP